MSNVVRGVPAYTLGIIISARMTSTRFPGKSMALLAGKPVLQRVIERAKRIDTNAKVIVSVPDKPESEPMLQLAEKMHVSNFCGDEYDVLKRTYDAAIFHGLDIIVRITGDCPFIDPQVCREVISLLVWRKLDYASNIFPNRSYPRGLDCEVFTMDCLEAAHLLANRPDEREHVTLWMQKNSEIVKANVMQKVDASDRNFCVDYPEDIPRLEKEIALWTPHRTRFTKLTLEIKDITNNDN